MVAMDQLQFFGGRKKSKNYFGHFFSNFNITLQQHVDVQVIFQRFYQNSKWPPEVSSKNFVGAKTLKLYLRNFLNFGITLPTGDFTEI